MVSVHGLLAALFLSYGEAQQHGRRAERYKVAYFMAPWRRNLENFWLASSFYHGYSIQVTSLLDGDAHIQGESFLLNYCPTY
jgi:hypothetical protein